MQNIAFFVSLDSGFDELSDSIEKLFIVDPGSGKIINDEAVCFHHDVICGISAWDYAMRAHDLCKP